MQGEERRETRTVQRSSHKHGHTPKGRKGSPERHAHQATHQIWEHSKTPNSTGVCREFQEIRCTNSYTGGKRSPPPNSFKLEPHPSSINLIPSLASSYFSFSSLPWVSLLSAQRNANTCTCTQECLCTHTNPQVSGFSRCLSPFPGSQT